MIKSAACRSSKPAGQRSARHAQHSAASLPVKASNCTERYTVAPTQGVTLKNHKHSLKTNTRIHGVTASPSGASPRSRCSPDSSPSPFHSFPPQTWLFPLGLATRSSPQTPQPGFQQPLWKPGRATAESRCGPGLFITPTAFMPPTNCSVIKTWGRKPTTPSTGALESMRDGEQRRSRKLAGMGAPGWGPVLPAGSTALPATLGQTKATTVLGNDRILLN